MSDQTYDKGPTPPSRRRTGGDVRTLGDADAEAFAELFVEIWRETYDGLMPAERLTGLSAQTAAERFRELVKDPSYPPTRGLFQDGRLVGWARAGDPRDDDAPRPLELWSLNVARTARGSGAARVLMDDVLRDSPAYLWVVEGNERALRFYEREGFVLDGVRRAEPNDGTDELRMVRGNDE